MKAWWVWERKGQLYVESTRHVQSILDLFAELGYNPRGRRRFGFDGGRAGRRLSGSGGRPRSWHDAGMAHPRIEFEADVFSPSGLTLLVDGTAQSHVDPDDPTRLFFEYVRRIGHVLDAVRPASAPIRALHLGGGAMTLPRYVAATRPGSSQVVVELDAELVATVLERLPLPRRRRHRRSCSPTRATRSAPTARSPARRRSTWSSSTSTRGSRRRRSSTTPTFMGGCLAALAAGGLVVVNVADAPGLTRLRAQARALARADPGAELLVAGDPSVARRRRGGQRGARRGARRPPRRPRRSARRGGAVPGRRAHRAPPRRRALGRLLTGVPLARRRRRAAGAPVAGG